MKLRGHTSRRRFLRSIGVGLAGAVAAPAILPAGVLAGPDGKGANERIGLGLIGAGRRGLQLADDLAEPPGLLGEVRVTAVCDVWPKKARQWCQRFDVNVLEPQGHPAGEYGIYGDYRELLDRRDVDAVIIATNDHWHALPAVHACMAGKDVFGEKPLSLTVAEGRAMVQAVRKYRRVFQVGTQQRSYLRNRQACELIRNGVLGRISEVRCKNYRSSLPASAYEIEPADLPEGLDWDRWCGQTARVPFSYGRYLTYDKPGWQWIREYSGGWMTNWGAHGLDMVQWALGKDDTGPVEFIPEGKKADSPVTFRYADGVTVRLVYDDDTVLGGGHFLGENGEMFMTRGRFNTIPIALSATELGDDAVRLDQSDNHMRNWLDCIRSRGKPAADVEAGHRTATICHLCGIARQLGRTLRWDPQSERFPGDDEANGYLNRPARKPYKLPESEVAR